MSKVERLAARRDVRGLLDLDRKTDAKTRQVIAHPVSRQGFDATYSKHDEKQFEKFRLLKLSIIDALSRSGPPAYAQLIAELGGPWREEALWALKGIGAPAVDQLIAALGAENEHIANGASQVLGGIRGPAVEPLVAALGTENDQVRRNAIWALRTMDSMALIDALFAENVKVRREAAHALTGQRGARVWLIRSALNDSDAQVRRAAVGALYSFCDRRDTDLVPRLFPALHHDEDGEVRERARALAVAIMGPWTADDLW